MRDVVRVEHTGRVTVVTLTRPERLNAIDTPTVEALGAAIAELSRSDDVGALVVTGEGRAFSAGADISELATFERPAAFTEFIGRLADAYDALARLSVPSVAAINGMALGGGLELALACDLRVAAPAARLGAPEVRLGLLPGAGGTARLTRMVPPAVAKQLLLTGEPITAADAWRLGLVNEVVEHGTALGRTLELAAQLASLPGLALAAAKMLVDEGARMSLADAVSLERQTVSTLFGTDDRIEGLDAFLHRRPPSFSGR